MKIPSQLRSIARRLARSQIGIDDVARAIPSDRVLRSVLRMMRMVRLS